MGIIVKASKSSKVTSSKTTCDWCGKKIELLDELGYTAGITTTVDLCRKCLIIAIEALELGRQVAQETLKGGCQLYIGVERTGQKTELLSVRRWSPLESLESAEFVDGNSHTFLSSLE